MELHKRKKAKANHNTIPSTWNQRKRKEYLIAMDLAIKFNESGCDFYQAGHIEQAYDMFCGAMQALHHSLHGLSKDDLPMGAKMMLLTDPSVQRAFDRIEAAPASRFLAPQNTTTDNTSTTCLVAGEFSFVWKRVISIEHLLTNERLRQCDQTTFFALAQSVVYFNQALILHTGMMRLSTRTMERALTLYSMALKQLFEYCPRATLQCCSSVITLTCAALNNTGYLLHETGEYDCSRLCFARINQFLSELGPPESQEERSRREEFGLNVLLFWRPLTSAAAA